MNCLFYRPQIMTNQFKDVCKWAISSLLSLIISTVAHSAQSHDLGRAMKTHEAKAGTLLVRTNDQDQLRPVPMLATDVTINVTGIVSRSIVTQHFKNPTDQWLEGIYVFPLPDTAAVDTLSMKIGERVIIGKIKERKQAKKIYEQAKSQGKKASLLEQERPNIFTTSLANIGPGEVIAVTIEYQETMRYDSGKFSLRFPTVVAPRYIPGTQTITGFKGTGWARNTDQVDDAARITPNYLNPKDGIVGPVIRIQAHINAGFPVTVVSRSHDIYVREDQTGSVIDLKKEVVPADRDFVLEWTPQVGTAPDAALFTDKVNKETYALIMVMPPDQLSEELKPLPREVIYVIDTSGSMDGQSIRQAKAALELALGRLSRQDTFNVIEFNSTSHRLFQSSQPATPENIQIAIQEVTQMVASGGTKMLSALKQALRNQRNSGRVRQVVFVTDGSVGNEQELLAYINLHIGQSRLFTVGIGSAPNGFFMRKAAELGRGTFTYIGRINEVKEKMNELFSKLETPVLSKIQVDWRSRAVEYYPKRIPDLYTGEPIVIAAKLSQLRGNVEISGWRGDKPWAVNFKLEGGRSHSGIDRLYARKKIETLLSNLAEGTSADAVRDEITVLGLSHHLVTQHTSLVAVEENVSRPQEEGVTSAPVPSNLPAGWVYDSVFGSENPRTLNNLYMATDSSNADYWSTNNSASMNLGEKRMVQKYELKENKLAEAERKRQSRNVLTMELPEASEAAEDSKTELRLAAAALMYETVMADYDLGQEEQVLIRKLVSKQFQLTQAETNELLTLAQSQVRDATDLHGFTTLINRNWTLKERILLVDSMWQVVYADRHLDDHEVLLLRKIQRLLHIPHREFLASKLRHKRS